jgi:hypothetical protein
MPKAVGHQDYGIGLLTSVGARIPVTKRPHEVIRVGADGLVFLVQGHEVIISPEDDWVLEHRWYLRGSGGKQVTCTAYIGLGRKKNFYLYRLLLDAPADKEVDHENRNRLDNRRSNLKLSTRKKNQENLGETSRGVSKHRGVHFDKTNKKWRAEVTHNYKSHKSPRFLREAEAAAWARDKREELYG